MYDAISDAIHDAIVVGGGPAGLSAALVLGRAARRVVLFDDDVPRNAKARSVHCFVGHDGIEPRALRQRAEAEIARYGVQVARARVQKAQAGDSGQREFPTQFCVCTREGQQAIGRKLLIATGVRDELPDIPGLLECYGISVHHCPYCDAWEHRDQPLFVIGHDPEEAVGLALSLRTWSGEVTLLGNAMPIEKKDVDRLRGQGINWREGRVERIVHDGGKLQFVELADGRRLPGKALFFAGQQHQASELARQLGCRLDNEKHAVSGNKQRTPVPGLFLAGDVDGDVQFAIVAAAEGAIAAVALNRELQEEDRNLDRRRAPDGEARHRGATHEPADRR